MIVRNIETKVEGKLENQVNGFLQLRIHFYPEGISSLCFDPGDNHRVRGSQRGMVHQKMEDYLIGVGTRDKLMSRGIQRRLS